jgi:hypothetical protein
MKDMSGKDVIGHFTAQILFKEDIKGTIDAIICIN